MKLSLTPAELRSLTFRPTAEELAQSPSLGFNVWLVIDGQAVGPQYNVLRGETFRFIYPFDRLTAASRVELKVL